MEHSSKLETKRPIQDYGVKRREFYGSKLSKQETQTLDDDVAIGILEETGENDVAGRLAAATSLALTASGIATARGKELERETMEAFRISNGGEDATATSKAKDGRHYPQNLAVAKRKPATSIMSGCVHASKAPKTIREHVTTPSSSARTKHNRIDVVNEDFRDKEHHCHDSLLDEIAHSIDMDSDLTLAP